MLAVAAGLDVTLWHVDHGLRAGSAAESLVVARLAERLGCGFEAVTVEVEGGGNVEAKARRARYGALPPDVATGHTADDQAETMLLNLLRGAAVDGLAAMTPGPRRPLLTLRRRDTSALCELFGLAVVEDPSNTDPRFLRNRVRWELLPLLAELSKRDMVPILCRQADHLRAVGDLLGEQADLVDPTDTRALRDAPRVVAQTALRRWLAALDPEGHPPDSATVARVLAVADLASVAAQTTGGQTVRRSRGRLYIDTHPHSHPHPGES